MLCRYLWYLYIICIIIYLFLTLKPFVRKLSRNSHRSIHIVTRASLSFRTQPCVTGMSLYISLNQNIYFDSSVLLYYCYEILTHNHTCLSIVCLFSTSLTIVSMWLCYLYAFYIQHTKLYRSHTHKHHYYPPSFLSFLADSLRHYVPCECQLWEGVCHGW